MVSDVTPFTTVVLLGHFPRNTFLLNARSFRLVESSILRSMLIVNTRPRCQRYSMVHSVLKLKRCWGRLMIWANMCATRPLLISSPMDSIQTSSAFKLRWFLLKTAAIRSRAASSSKRPTSSRSLVSVWRSSPVCKSSRKYLIWVMVKLSRSSCPLGWDMHVQASWRSERLRSVKMLVMINMSLNLHLHSSLISQMLISSPPRRPKPNSWRGVLWIGNRSHHTYLEFLWRDLLSCSMSVKVGTVVWIVSWWTSWHLS